MLTVPTVPLFIIEHLRWSQKSLFVKYSTFGPDQKMFKNAWNVSMWVKGLQEKSTQITNYGDFLCY